jgi:hypothetical protein
MCEGNFQDDGTLTPTAKRNQQEAKILKDSIRQIQELCVAQEKN